MSGATKKYVGINCAVDGCEREASFPHNDGPVCNTHYLRSRRHGSFDLPKKINKSLNPAYHVWKNMKSRCLNPKATGYENYGGRGISICPSWSSSFETFLRDVGPRPSARHTLDRIDVNKGYEPNNCRWATQKVQCRNRQVNHIVMIDGVRMTLADAVDSAPVCYNTALHRIKRGWTASDAVSRPPQQGTRP